MVCACAFRSDSFLFDSRYIVCLCYSPSVSPCSTYMRFGVGLFSCFSLLFFLLLLFFVSFIKYWPIVEHFYYISVRILDTHITYIFMLVIRVCVYVCTVFLSFAAVHSHLVCCVGEVNERSATFLQYYIYMNTECV